MLFFSPLMTTVEEVYLKNYIYREPINILEELNGQIQEALATVIPEYFSKHFLPSLSSRKTHSKFDPRVLGQPVYTYLLAALNKVYGFFSFILKFCVVKTKIDRYRE
jgi:hypothetical protein